MSKASPSRSSGFRFPLAETVALLMILIIGGMAAIGVQVISDRLESGARTGGPAAQDPKATRVLTSDQANAVLTVAANLRETQSGQDTASAEWSRMLQTDPKAFGVFILRNFTTLQYFSQQKDDTAFAEDVRLLLAAAGSSEAFEANSFPAARMLPNDSAASNTSPEDATQTARQSRLAWLKNAVDSAGFNPDGLGETPSLAGHLESLALTDLNLKPDSTIVGRQTISGIVNMKTAQFAQIKPSRFTGTLGSIQQPPPLKVRQILFFNNSVQAASPALAAEVEKNSFSLSLDVRHQAAGMYQAQVLAIGSDGRGVWQEIGTLRVPEVLSLKSGEVKTMILSATEPDRYVSIPASMEENDRRFALSVVNPDGPVAAELFALDGTRIAESDNPDDQWESLKAVVPEGAAAKGNSHATGAGHFPMPPKPEESQIAYGRVTRSDGLASPDRAIRFTLVQSEQVALSRSAPEQIFAVMGKNDNGLSLKDSAGQMITRQESDVRLVDFAGRLSDLTLTGSTSKVSFFPLFEPETDQYGLYLPPESAGFSIGAWAREGSFANIRMVLESANNPSRNVIPGEQIRPEAGDNILSLTVRNGDGIEKTYRLHILASSLATQGYHLVLESFPESYRSPLYLLHIKRPDYVFQADLTDLTFTEFVDAQAFKDRSLVEATTVPDSWVVPGSPVYDGKSWKAASREIVAYFGDPRNFLNERDIFQFETLAFDATYHTRTAVEAILAGTFMSPDHEKNREKIDYAGLIMRAADQAKISPLFIAAKIIQEMGRNGESPLAYGRLPGYEDAYNFYNIGATPNPSVPDGARINGALYALYGRKPDEREITADEEVFLLPWVTPERAITGGAIWIARSYIAIGQDTLYLQKFDLVAEDGLFIHQYAQNIQMAWAEGRRTFSAYQEMGLLNMSFVFRIPVFLDMPSEWSPRPG